jgi:hypothetical protein
MSEEKKEVPKEEVKKDAVDVEALKKERDGLAKEKADFEKRLKSIEGEKTKSEQKALEEQNKFKELYEGLKPKAERHDLLESTLTEYYEAEIKDIPADKVDLIPEGSIESRLKWVKQAKVKGLFGEQAKAPVNTVNKKPNADPTQPEYLSWSPDDRRLLKLNPLEARAYRAHRTIATTGNAAWGRV